MVIVRVSFEVTPEGVDAVRRVADERVEEPGKLQYELLQDPNASTRWLLYEEWSDRASFDAYKASEHFRRSGAVLFPLMVGKPRSAYYEVDGPFGP